MIETSATRYFIVNFARFLTRRPALRPCQFYACILFFPSRYGSLVKESFPQLVRNRANPSIWKLLPKRKPKDLNEFNSPTTVLLLSRIHLFSFTRKGLLNSIKKILLFLRHNLCSYKCYRKAKKKSRSIPKRCKPTKREPKNSYHLLKNKKRSLFQRVERWKKR